MRFTGCERRGPASTVRSTDGTTVAMPVPSPRSGLDGAQVAEDRTLSPDPVVTNSLLPAPQLSPPSDSPRAVAWIPHFARERLSTTGGRTN